jgi:hypothetical protein
VAVRVVRDELAEFAADLDPSDEHGDAGAEPPDPFD